jgi:hypothetical protein
VLAALAVEVLVVRLDLDHCSPCEIKNDAERIGIKTAPAFVTTVKAQLHPARIIRIYRIALHVGISVPALWSFGIAGRSCRGAIRVRRHEPAKLIGVIALVSVRRDATFEVGSTLDSASR